MAEYVHKDVTVVVGTDEEADVSVIFVVSKAGGIAFSFPRPAGVFKELSFDDMELFLAVTPESKMLEAIREAWRKVYPLCYKETH